MAIDPNNLSQTAQATFDDEFDALSLWNGDKGRWATDVWYDDLQGKGYSFADNGEQEWYINSNYGPTSTIKPWSVKDGILSITAAKTDAATKALLDGYDYTSGSLNTFHSFSQTYGYFEMRAKLPEGQGFWPAFWLLPEDGSWPPELDVMEVLGKDLTQLYLTAHSGAKGHHTQKGSHVTVADMSKGYHTYSVDWEPDFITWYFDHKKIARVATPPDMNKPMYMVVNLAVGGDWGGDADGTTPFPGKLKVDYIRAYQSLSDKDLTVTANGSAHQVLRGGTGDDTFKAGDNSVVMTGYAGADTFLFGMTPKNAGHITDFTPGTDKIDVADMLYDAGYLRGVPFADGYLQLTRTDAGSTKLWFDDDGAAGPHHRVLVTEIDGVLPKELHKVDFVALHPHATLPGDGEQNLTDDHSDPGHPTHPSTMLEHVIAAALHQPSDYVFA